MPYQDIYTGTLQAFVDQMAKLSEFQTWVGAADEAEASEHVHKWYFPNRQPGENRKFAMLDLGQEHVATKSAINGNGRDYFHSGSIVWLLRQELSGVDDNVPAYQASTDSFFESVSKIQKDMEAVQQISTSPSNIIPMTIEMQGWWRPEEEEMATQGDFLEWWALITYERDS